jgi:putative colanic acid biosynthesis acetyltransferase WcaF
MHKTDLSGYNNDWYKPGGGLIKRAAWFLVNACFFASGFPFNGIKVALLRLFGAQIGKGLVIKPSVHIKYPWNLYIGNYVWIGEKVWIDNLARVAFGDNCCISQGALLLCGNHNYKKKSFDLITGSITLEEGVWIGAMAIVGPGITCYSHAVLSAGSVANKDLSAYSIYQGNPAQKIRERVFE